MATIRCSGCSNLVAFKGKAATCPSCGTPLTLPGTGGLLDIGESADPSVGPAVPTLVAEYGRTRNTSVYGSGGGGSAPAMKLMVLGGVGLLILGLLLSVLWWYMSRPTTTAIAPAPAPITKGPLTPLPPPPPVTDRSPKAPQKPATAPAVVQAPPPKPVLRPVAPSSNSRALTDEQINAAIQKSVGYILGCMDGPGLNKKLQDEVEKPMQSGMHALGVYALAAAGKETKDPRLDPRSPAMRAMIEKMKTGDFSGHFEIYARSLRLQALAFINRPEDRPMIESELRWILHAGVGGAWGYTEAKPGQDKTQIGWDTSNSQYGLLGAWAASMAGFETPPTFWSQVEQHWMQFQEPEGGWGYPQRYGVTSSMTAAGVNALLVAADQLVADRTIKGRDPAATHAAIMKGLSVLGTREYITQFRQRHYGYSSYGVERVGLASGYKFLGGIDWFRTMASMMVEDQQPNGAFRQDDPGFADTAFCTLFLVRGRPPVMMAKLRYDGAWQKYPRDLANLAIFGTAKTERPLNWQVVDLASGWREWLDAPVLMISGKEPPVLTDDQIDNLRQYYLHGGLIFTHADGGSPEFTQWVSTLAGQILDGGKLDTLGPDHPLYSIMLRPSPAPQLQAVMGGNRIAILHSPTDLSVRWLRRVAASNQQNLETGLNVFIYAAGKALNRTRLDSPVLPLPADEPVGSVTLGRIEFGPATSPKPTTAPASTQASTQPSTQPASRPAVEDMVTTWNPEPAAWSQAGQDFELATRIHVDVKAVRPAALTEGLKMATLTSVGAFKLAPDEAGAIRKWVEGGGVLLVDPCGGRKPAADAVAAAVTQILGTVKATAAAATDPMLTGAGYGRFGTDVTKVIVTDFTLAERGGKQPPPRIAKLGKGYVIASDLDMTTALLDTNVWGITGYTSRWTRGFVRNVMLSVACETPMVVGSIEKPTTQPAK